jgi:hypothetical protein
MASDSHELKRIIRIVRHLKKAKCILRLAEILDFGSRLKHHEI